MVNTLLHSLSVGLSVDPAVYSTAMAAHSRRLSEPPSVQPHAVLEKGENTCCSFVQAIMLVESIDGSMVLLGRAKTIRHASMLTCLSGFVEQVETIEEACRREVMEESGITVGPVHIAGSQPWPMGTAAYIFCCCWAMPEPCCQSSSC